MNIFQELAAKIDKKRSIVYPEGNDPRILKACERLVEDEIIHPIVLGSKDEIQKLGQEKEISLDGIEIIDFDFLDKTEYIDEFLKIRKGKNTEDQAREMFKSPNYLTTMMVKLYQAGGMVAGAVSSTGDTIRPALQIIKTEEGVSRISGAMFMYGPNDERYVFADVAINIDHEPEGLAEIAYQSAKTGQVFGIDPKIAFLSFSTKGSASAPQTEKVIEAVDIAREKYPDLKLDGELQFDAAIVPEVAKLKAPESEIAGKANVFIFPDLEAGNIGYKIAERLGGYEAIGPILQGLAAPIADLSRGCDAEDVYKLSIVTALQIQAKSE